MKIEKKAEDCINFGKVQCGDMFRDDDGRYYMKLIGASQYTAVELDAGILAKFNDYKLVTLMPNAKIVI